MRQQHELEIPTSSPERDPQKAVNCYANVPNTEASLNTMFETRETRGETRQSNSTNVNVASVRTETGERANSIRGSLYWNSAAIDIRNIYN